MSWTFERFFKESLESQIQSGKIARMTKEHGLFLCSLVWATAKSS